MVGENDIKYLFIYSIGEEIPVITVIKLSKRKDGTVLLHSLVLFFFCLCGGYCDDDLNYWK